ncbi:uncharacterized protein [Branchiostoma lanceolatum]|uniref:uncharacterized protein n=1 Tax=Branchiostoma lanceolatum TaxID=7740 RepID=UPI003454C30E
MKEGPPRESRANLIEHQVNSSNLTQRQQTRNQADVQTRPTKGEIRDIERGILGDVLKEVDELSHSLLRGKAEMGYMEVGTKGVRIVVGKSSGVDTGGAGVSVNKDRVTLPSAAALFGDCVPDIVRLKVVEFEENPFVWATSGSTLGSSVVNVDLYDSMGESIPIQDLPEDIRITVQNNLPPPDVTLLSTYAPGGHSPMTFRSFDISGNESYLVTVTLQAPSLNVTLYGSVGTLPLEYHFRYVMSFIFSWLLENMETFGLF